MRYVFPPRHVDDIDLFVGAMSEIHLPGANVGPIFAKLIATQFKALKEGDRFWYEHRHHRTGFTEGKNKQFNHSRSEKRPRQTG